MLLVQRLALLSFITLITILCAQQIVAADITYTDYHAARNGELDDWGGWFTERASIAPRGAKDGTGGARFEIDPGDQAGLCYQELTIPTSVDSATVSFDYRSLIQYDHHPEHYPLELYILLGTSQGCVGDACGRDESPEINLFAYLAAIPINTAQDWTHYNWTLSQDIIDAINQAHAAGNYIFLIATVLPAENGGNATAGFYTDIDNLFLTVNGTQQVPEMTGLIAYQEEDENNDPTNIGLLDPNTHQARILWSRPEGPGYYSGDIAWSPDGSEIAFVTDHERVSSALTGDIYAIKPDGTDLREITGPSLIDYREWGLSLRHPDRYCSQHHSFRTVNNVNSSGCRQWCSNGT